MQEEINLNLLCSWITEDMYNRFCEELNNEQVVQTIQEVYYNEQNTMPTFYTSL